MPDEPGMSAALRKTIAVGKGLLSTGQLDHLKMVLITPNSPKPTVLDPVTLMTQMGVPREVACGPRGRTLISELIPMVIADYGDDSYCGVVSDAVAATVTDERRLELVKEYGESMLNWPAGTTTEVLLCTMNAVGQEPRVASLPYTRKGKVVEWGEDMIKDFANVSGRFLHGPEATTTTATKPEDN